MSREALREVWPGGLGWRTDEVEVLWLYSVLQPVVLVDDRVAGFAIGVTTDEHGAPLHPDLEGFGVGHGTSAVRAQLGAPETTWRLEGPEGRALEVWSYGLDRPRYLFVEYPASEEPTLMGLVVGLRYQPPA